MKILAIRAKNFRTLEDFEIRFQPNYCALSGRNNAGKSTIISIIQHFLDGSEDYRYFPNRDGISFSSDKTQWSSADTLEIEVEVDINRLDDSELYFFLDKFSPRKITGDDVIVCLRQVFTKEDPDQIFCKISDIDLDSQTAREIHKKFKSSQNLIVHNSTDYSPRYIYGGFGMTEILETNFSADDRKKISDAQSRLQNSVKRAAKQHKEELDKLLGRLNDKFQVELSSLGSGVSSRFPLAIKLTDKRVDVSLKDWGAGTQNRTRILISALEAIRMRSTESADNRTTPLLIIEEPESFLHPSAQAEFGKMLNGLASELDLQFIATTHSPYMLNQNDPSANYLLERKMYRGSPKETVICPTQGDNWMLPFAENLGIVSKEFESWESLFNTKSSKIILVEGEIDKEYFDYISKKYPDVYTLSPDIDVVEYGGKDSLKNTSILQFMLNRFSRVFITYDLDAEREVTKALERIGLKKDVDHCPIGVNSDGKDCIEGLVPEVVQKKVLANNLNTVMALGSQDPNIRKSAKNRLKREFLEEFKKADLTEKDLKDFRALFRKIAKALG